MDKFTTKSIRCVTGATVHDIEYTRVLMKTETGIDNLFSEEPKFNRASVTNGHIRAIRQIIKDSKVMFDATWKVKLALETNYPQLSPL